MGIDTAVILAGGLGTRLRSVVPDVPKPMAPISGQPFLAYQLRYLSQQGIRNVLLSVGYKHDVIINYFGHAFAGLSLDYVIEQEPLGTGGGLWCAMNKLSTTDPFILLNGDTYFPVKLATLMESACINNADCVFSLFKTNNTIRFMGIDIASDGKIKSLQISAAGCSKSL